MREIKLRFWCNDVKSMIESGNSDQFSVSLDGRLFDNGFTFSSQANEIENVHLMQFTGVKNKNGVEVYEGDVLELKVNEHYWRYVVGSISSFGGMLWALMYENNLSTTEIDGDEIYSYKTQKVELGTRRDFVHETMEVIGNIHENPELLK